MDKFEQLMNFLVALVKEMMCYPIPSQICLVVVIEICVLEQFGDILAIYIARWRLNIRTLIKFCIASTHSLPLFLASYTCCLSHEILYHFPYDACSHFGWAGWVCFAVFEIIHNLHKNPVENVRLVVTWRVY